MRSGEVFLSAQPRRGPAGGAGRGRDGRGVSAGVPRTHDWRARRARPCAVVAGAAVSAATTLDALLAAIEPGAIAIENALRVQRAEALSVTDDLTQLYNSRFLSQVLRRETKRASRSGRPLSLLFVDLDGFKSINDSHGHLFGSRALVEAAGVIRASARETDMVARFGGDEFALILPDTGSDGAVSVGERVRDRIAAFSFLARRRPEHPPHGVGRRRDAARRRRIGRRADSGGRRGHVLGQGPRQERHITWRGVRDNRRLQIADCRIADRRIAECGCRLMD